MAEKILIPQEILNTPVANDPLQAPDVSVLSDLSDSDLKSASNEVQTIEKYGDAPLRTAAEAALSSATFGLSDQALSAYSPEMAEALRERRRLNPGSALVGEVAGVVVPTLASGGTSIAVKGVQAAGKGVLAAESAGRAVEGLSAAALKKLFKETGRQKLSQQVVQKALSKGAGSAVEGSFYGLGKLISEEALGNADFNAENVAASAGIGALLGGAAGGVFGASEALIPVIKNNKVVDYVTKKIKPDLDASKAAAELSGFTPKQFFDLKNKRPDIAENLQPFFNNRIKLETLDSSEAIYNKIRASVDDIGNDIGATLNKIDEIAPQHVLPTRANVAESIVSKLQPLKNDFTDIASSSAKKYLKQIDGEIDSWQKWAQQSRSLSGKEVHDLKVKLQKLASWDKKFDSISLPEKIAREASDGVREQLLKLADNVSLNVDQNLGKQLRQQNLDYGTAIEVNKRFSSKMAKEDSKGILSLKDSIIGGIGYNIEPSLAVATVALKKFAESDFKRKLIITTNIERSIQNVNNKISSGIKSAFQGSKKAVKSGGIRGMLGISFELPDKRESKSSKNRLEAFNRIQSEINNLSTDMNRSLKYLANNSMRVTGAAPLTASALDSTIVRGIEFLRDKLPKAETSSGGLQLLKRQWIPSTIELAKFEQYVEGVENPLSAIEDIQAGKLTREKVEVLQTIYPTIYQKIQEEIMANLPEYSEKLTYSQRLQLGILMDIETDTSLQPENIAALQVTFADAQNEAAERQQASGLNAPLDMQNRASDAQKVQERRS